MGTSVYKLCAICCNLPGKWSPSLYVSRTMKTGQIGVSGLHVFWRNHRRNCISCAYQGSSSSCSNENSVATKTRAGMNLGQRSSNLGRLAGQAWVHSGNQNWIGVWNRQMLSNLLSLTQPHQPYPAVRLSLKLIYTLSVPNYSCSLVPSHVLLYVTNWKSYGSHSIYQDA